MPYKINILNLDQGTDEWLKWRSGGITSTTAAVLMGNDPYSTLMDLWEVKTGLKESDFEMNDAIQHGIDTEPFARSLLQKHTGEIFDPACVELVKYPQIKSSLDGINKDLDIIAEIKCTKKLFRFAQLSSKIPNYYYCQMQHHLLASQADVCCFFPFYNQTTFRCKEVYADKDFQIELLKRALLFQKYVQNKEVPDLKEFSTYYILPETLKIK